MEKPKYKTVQEVIAAGDGLPERYLHTPTGDGEGQQPLNASAPEMDIPAIDLTLLLSSSQDGREELSKLHSALSTWGVVQVFDLTLSRVMKNLVDVVLQVKSFDFLIESR